MKDHATGKFLFLDPTDLAVPSDEAPVSADVLPSDAKEAVAALMSCLTEAGYDPVTQLTAYLIADDPTFLPEETEARAIARRVGRDKLLEALLTFYWEHHAHDC